MRKPAASAQERASAGIEGISATAAFREELVQTVGAKPQLFHPLDMAQQPDERLG